VIRRALIAASLFALPSLAQAKTVAVVVGNNEPPAGAPGEGLATLRYADDDAHRYAELLRRFTDETVLLTVYDRQTRERVRDAAVDGPPTLAALRKTLASFDGEEDLTVYIVFTGHGALDEAGAPFLAMLDAPLTRDLLFDTLLAKLDAKRVHLIIDACHAAGVVGIRGGRFGKEIDGSTSAVTEDDEERWAKERTLARFPHVGVLASSSAGESSHEWSVLEAGVFSHEILSGMWGAADINEDRRIEYSELQSFVASANRAVADPRAKPSVVVHPPALDPHEAIVDLASLRETALLEGDLSSIGHFHVELSDGRRHLDGNVGGPVALAVPPGTAYLRAGETEYVVEARAGQRVAFDSLTARPAQALARGSTEASFRRELFAEPYTYDYYRGYVDSVGATPVAAPVRAEAVPAPPPPVVRSPPPLQDEPPSAQRRPHAERAGAAFVSLSVVSGVTALGTGIAAAAMRANFNAASNERNAARFTEPHRQLATVAVTTAVVSGVTGLVGGLLLRRAKRAKAD
jgi:hypothetical protein